MSYSSAYTEDRTLSRTISTSFYLEPWVSQELHRTCEETGLKKTTVVNALLSYFVQLEPDQQLDLIRSARASRSSSTAPGAAPASSAGVADNESRESATSPGQVAGNICPSP